MTTHRTYLLLVTVFLAACGDNEVSGTSGPLPVDGVDTALGMEDTVADHLDAPSGADVDADVQVTDALTRVDTSAGPLPRPERPPVRPMDAQRTGVDAGSQEPDSAPLSDGESDTGSLCPAPSCAWLGQPCEAQTAVLEIVALDVWAQPLKSSTLVVSPKALDDITLDDTLVATGPLCAKTTLEISLSADHHQTFEAEITYDPFDDPYGFEVKETGEDSAWSVTTDLRDTETGPVRHHTLWVGLVHRWFAPSGRPARHGNDVHLLKNGEEAFVQAYVDALQAESSLTASTWWWESDFELVRDPSTHIWLDDSTRWSHTILGVMEEKGWEGVESRVLVNQFFSQDGMLSDITYDSWISTAAMSPANGVEFMGQANTISGAFQVEINPVDFGERIAWAWQMPDGYELVGNGQVTPPMGPYDVDMSDLPLGLSVFDIPHAVWHQKFLTVDHQVALVGGMNFKSTDWDTDLHDLYDWRRMEFEASIDDRFAVFDKEAYSDTEPRRDYMLRVEGPVVGDLESVFAWRWQTLLAWDVYYAQYASDFQLGALPDPVAGGIQAQLLTTMPPPWNEMGIVDSLLRAIDQAEHYILIEDQYFRAPILAERIAQRMLLEPQLQFIMITNEVSAWTDPGCWQTHIEGSYLQGLFPERFHLFSLNTFDAHDVQCTLCWDEVLGQIERVFIHSKVVLIDDIYALIGSANHNNRGLLYEGEMSVAVFDPSWVHDVREQIVEDLLGPYYGAPGLTKAQLAAAFQGAAGWNQLVYDEWAWALWDLDLDGDPLPYEYIPEGFVYPLDVIDPDSCVFEDVGVDIM